MNSGKTWRRQFRQYGSLGAGMTLLEVMLALALTAVVLAAISMAIDLHLRLLDARRGDVERIQLARAILQIMANDLRSVIQQNTTDFSSLASMASDAAASGGASGDLGDLAGGDAGDMDALADAAADMMGGDTGGMSASQDIATAGTPPPVPGLYGNQYELQLDISRIPRVDEMQRMVASSLTNPIQDIPSDVKTVAYYVYDPSSGVSSGDFRDAAGNPQGGLVRRVLDRAVTLYAMDSANSDSVQQAGEIIAPEIVGIEFQYFDGLEWLYEWDSAESQGLPMAVRVTIVVAMSEAAELSSASPLSATDEQLVPEQTFSLVVRLPTAQPAEQSDVTGSSGMESVGL